VANELDEVNGPENPEGRDVRVIDKQLSVEIGTGTKIFEASLWLIPLIVAAAAGASNSSDVAMIAIAFGVGLLPGLLFQYLKTLAISYLRKLQQKIQADASQIDNYLEQRVVILTNLANLVSTSVELDKEVMTTIAAYRSGIRPETDASRNAASSDLDRVMSGINVAFEKYPDLQAQDNIAEAMRQNSNLQKEITAARTLYNDTVTRWNQDIYSWPTKQIVASRAGYTTRVPFIASAEMRAAARGNFF